MFVRTLDELEKLERIKFPSDHSFRSARFIIASDDMGFSYNENRVNEGVILNVWLKNHWEANYIVSGRVEVTDSESGKKWSLEAGAVYVVGPNDRHQLQFKEDECHLSVFFPPLSGNEHFDEDGSYEQSGAIEKTHRRMFVRHVDELRKSGCEVMKNNGQLRTIEMLGESDRIGFGLAVWCHKDIGTALDYHVSGIRHLSLIKDDLTFLVVQMI